MIVTSSLRHGIILTYGSFDLFSQNHVRLLRDLSGMCEELIVGCATDSYCLEHAEPCAVSYSERRAMLEHCRFVSRVIPFETLDQQHTDIINHNVSALAMDRSWRGRLDGLRDIVRLLYLADSDMPFMPAKQAIPVMRSAIY